MPESKIKIVDLPVIFGLLVLICVIVAESLIFLPQRIEDAKDALNAQYQAGIFSGLRVVQHGLDARDYRQLDDWIDSLSQSDVPTEVWAIAPNGTIMAASDIDQKGKFYRDVTDSAGFRIDDLLLLGMEQHVVMDEDEDWFAWYLRLHFPPQNGFGRGRNGVLVIRVDPTETIDNLRWSSLAMELSIFAIGLVFILFCRWVLGRRYGLRVNGLLFGLRQFAEGGSVPKIDDKHPDELGDIARGVSELFRDLDHKINHISELSEYFKAIYDNNLDSIVVIRPGGNIVTANLAAVKAFGYQDMQELVGKPVTVLMDTLHAQNHQAYVDRYMGGTRSDVINSMRRITARRKDGSRFPVDIMVVDLRVGEDVFFVGFVRDKTSAQNYENEIHRQLYFDEKSGLPNRRSLEDFLEAALVLPAEPGRYLMLEIGIDQMRSINATFGFGCGDTVIMEMADRLSSCLKTSDFLCRLSGDRFIAVHELREDEDPVSALSGLADNIHACLRKPVSVAGGEVDIRVTIGGLVLPDLASAPVDAIQFSELALFEAKARFRGQVYLLQDDDQLRIRNNAALVHDIGRALERNEFHVYMQPKVNLETGKVQAAECLVRWTRSDGTMVPPDAFISVAEASGYIGYIGRFVFQRACMALQKWQDDPVLKDIRLAVNVSPFELSNANYIDEILAIAASYGIGLKRLELEITESSMGGDTGLLQRQINAMQTAGFDIAIDDFGTGESSLSKLKYMDAHRLKIDKSFLSDVEDDSRSEALLKHVIELAQSQKMRVTVEGIEDQAMEKRIRQMGGNEGQGYLYAKPLPAADFEAFVRNQAGDDGWFG